MSAGSNRTEAGRTAIGRAERSVRPLHATVRARAHTQRLMTSNAFSSPVPAIPPARLFQPSLVAGNLVLPPAHHILDCFIVKHEHRVRRGVVVRNVGFNVAMDTRRAARILRQSFHKRSAFALDAEVVDAGFLRLELIIEGWFLCKLHIVRHPTMHPTEPRHPFRLITTNRMGNKTSPPCDRLSSSSIIHHSSFIIYGLLRATSLYV